MPLKYIRDFAKQFSPTRSPGINALKDELLAEFHERLILALQKLDLVPRHEFDIQSEQLKKAKAALKALEDRILHLEKS